MRHRPTRNLVLVSLLALGLLFAADGFAGKRMLDFNPANEPELIDKSIENPNTYDRARRCVDKPRKGTRKLIRFMKRYSKRDTYYGTIRCESLGSGMSVHSDGRALDWGLDARKKMQKRQAMAIIRTWFDRDNKGRRTALARRMGIQMVIYNCKYWMAGDGKKMRDYHTCSRRSPTVSHIDHLHIELNRKAAKLRTSYWQSPYAPGGGASGGGGTQTGGVKRSGGLKGSQRRAEGKQRTRSAQAPDPFAAEAEAHAGHDH